MTVQIHRRCDEDEALKADPAALLGLTRKMEAAAVEAITPWQSSSFATSTRAIKRPDAKSQQR